MIEIVVDLQSFGFAKPEEPVGVLRGFARFESEKKRENTSIEWYYSDPRVHVSV